MLRELILTMAIVATAPTDAMNVPADPRRPVSVEPDSRDVGKGNMPECGPCFETFDEGLGYYVHSFFSHARAPLAARNLNDRGSIESAGTAVYVAYSPSVSKGAIETADGGVSWIVAASILPEGGGWMKCSGFNACHGNEQQGFCGQYHWACDTAVRQADRDIRVAVHTRASKSEFVRLENKHRGHVRIDFATESIDILDCDGRVVSRLAAAF
jgi:hypothetical protein